MPEGIGELARGQPVAEGGFQLDAIQALLGDPFHGIPAVEHEQGGVHVGPDVRCELGQVGLPQRRSGGLALAPPQQEVRQVRAQRTRAEQATPASVVGGRVAGRRDRAMPRQFACDLARCLLDGGRYRSAAGWACAGPAKASSAIVAAAANRRRGLGLSNVAP